ncbi:unnamed protein product [Hermetia illucens]|uniref:Farnesoic acid O-methyl transferase domain-containing protein n=2 Tax=Hermetia illucens TaxID=343691 RepID=A0A7R8Z334_HERIL|nr:unnamed protein product [Hermetia illucens]
MAKNDANIVLSNSQGKGTVQYTIVVGGADNTYSWLRNTSDTTVGLDSHTPGLLSPLFPTPVIVRQKHNGQVEVSVPGITDPLLRADAADLEVQSICFYAWNTQSRWFYNCAEKEDSCSVVKRNCAQLNSRKN